MDIQNKLGLIYYKKTWTILKSLSVFFKVFLVSISSVLELGSNLCAKIGGGKRRQETLWREGLTGVSLGGNLEGGRLLNLFLEGGAFI